MAALSKNPSVSLEDILSRHGLKRKDLERKYPARVRPEITELLDDWKMVGQYLSIDALILKDIQVENHTEERRRVALLDAWDKKEGEGATYLKLAEAIHQRGKRTDLVEKLCEIIKTDGVQDEDTKRNVEEPPSKKPRKSEGENNSKSKKISAKYNGTTYTFVEAVPGYLRCKKCRSLPVDPHRAHCQRSYLFCKSCLQHKQSFCDCDIDPDPESKTQIEELDIMCPNSALGCKWEKPLGNVVDHCLICPKEKVPCTYSDIGCTDEMLREEVKDHEDKDRTKHLDFAMKTITEMKKQNDSIRTEMSNLQDLFRKKLEEQKTNHGKAIQRSREEISQCPPLIAKMTTHSGDDDSLSVFSLVNYNSQVFTSSSFYSHPQGYKLCLVLKCCGSNPQLNDEKKDLTVKLKISALFQDQSSLSWPCKGVAIVTLQPEGLKASQLSVDFDITAPPSDSSTDHIVSEPGFSDHNLPREWRDSTRGLTPRNLTLKIEKIDIII